MQLGGRAQQLQCTRPTGPRRCCRVHAIPDWLRAAADFNSWAPKSSRIWRLQQWDSEAAAAQRADEVDELEQKVNRLQASQSAASRSQQSLDEDAEPSPTKSFSEAGDNELAKALSARIQSIATASMEAPTDSLSEEDEVTPMTGQEMRDLIYTKFGKTYDVSLVRRDIPGKSFVCLNIMWQHLEQRSFKMSEETYMEKLDSVAYLVNVLGQTTKVRAFLRAPAKAERGLPKRPVVGCAVSIQFDLEKEVVDEFFGAGYQ